jgi:hypothetical protein
MLKDPQISRALLNIRLSQRSITVIRNSNLETESYGKNFFNKPQPETDLRAIPKYIISVVKLLKLGRIPDETLIVRFRQKNWSPFPLKNG